jgi:hypothetical protein
VQHPSHPVVCNNLALPAQETQNQSAAGSVKASRPCSSRSTIQLSLRPRGRQM